MSRIEDLIAELCPAGVEFGAVADCVIRPQGIRWTEHPGEQFQYINLTSVDRVTHRIVDTATITSENAPSRAQQIVRVGDVVFGTTRPTLKRYAVIPAGYDGQICSTGFCVLRPDTRVMLTNFLFHLLGAGAFYEYVEANQRGASYPAISDSLVKKYRIPIPPLEAQSEVARVLDAFASLEAKLEAELEAELEARERQYERYRDSLVTFTEGGGVEWVTLGDVANVRVGQAPPPDLLHDGGSVPFVNAGTTASGLATSANTAGEAITIPSRGQGGVGIVGYQSAPFWCGPLCYRITANFDGVITRYLYFFLKSIQASIRALQQTGGTPALNRKELVLVRIALPPLADQERIVAILDKFDALVNDLSIGLPAELNARRLQYEHYRDRLLTFRETA